MLFPQHKMYYIWQYSVGQIKGVWNKIGSYFMYIKKKKKGQNYIIFLFA